MVRREDKTMELSAEEKWKRSRAALSMLLGTSIKAISESYGKEGLEKVAKAWEENNKKAAKRLMEIVGRQERDLEPAARIIDFTDSIYGVEGEWKEIGPKRAVKIEKSCPLAKQFPPETCTACFTGSMQGIARGVLGHDQVICRMPKSLPGGDDCCEIILEVKD
jgi:predicted ArsR family transcriptional regulator